MDKAEKATGNAIQTERLDIVPSVEPWVTTGWNL